MVNFSKILSTITHTLCKRHLPIFHEPITLSVQKITLVNYYINISHLVIRKNIFKKFSKLVLLALSPHITIITQNWETPGTLS